MENISLKIHSDIYTGENIADKIAFFSEKYKRIMFIKDPDIDIDLAKPFIDEITKNNGECIVFDNIPPRATSRVIDETCKFIKKSFCRAVAGFGGQKILSIARITAAIGESDIRIDDIMDNPSLFELLDGEKKALGYAEIPSSFRYPFMFTDSAAVNDGRIRKYRVMQSVICPELIISDSSVFKTVSSKLSSAIKYEIFMNCAEGLLSAKKNMLSDMYYKKALNILSHDDFDSLCRAGMLSDIGMAFTFPGAGFFTSGIINSRINIPKAAAAAVIFPYFLELLFRKTQDPQKMLKEMAEAYGIWEDPMTQEDFVNKIRQETAEKNLPMRLYDLGIKQEHLALFAENFNEISKFITLPFPVGQEDITELLKAAF